MHASALAGVTHAPCPHARLTLKSMQPKPGRVSPRGPFTLAETCRRKQQLQPTAANDAWNLSPGTAVSISLNSDGTSRFTEPHAGDCATRLPRAHACVACIHTHLSPRPHAAAASTCSMSRCGLLPVGEAAGGEGPRPSSAGALPARDADSDTRDTMSREARMKSATVDRRAGSRLTRDRTVPRYRPSARTMCAPA